MRKIAIFMLVLLLVSGGIYGWRTGAFDQLLKGRDASPSTTQKAVENADDVMQPTFGTIRAEPSGEIVIAGRAEPGWTVTVESSGVVVGSVTALDNGDWLIMPTKPLAQGEHTLQLKAQNPKTARTLFSKQRIALSLTPGKNDRPLTALMEEGKPTKVLQMPFSSANAAGEPTGALGAEATQTGAAVSFTALDYEDAGAQSKLHLSGMASPGARIQLYINNDYAGAATADADGRWSYSGSHVLQADVATALRADVVHSGKVVVRAEVSFDRNPQRALAEAEAQKATASTGVTPKTGSTGAVAKAPTTDAPASQGQGVATLRDANGNVIIVRRGDTLWHIAKRMYGSGEKYTQIFQNNRGQIRNPNLIYPEQKFSVPK